MEYNPQNSLILKIQILGWHHRRRKKPAADPKGTKVSHRKATKKKAASKCPSSPQATAAPAQFPVPPFATGKTPEEVYTFFTGALRETYQQGMVNGVQKLLKNSRDALGAEIGLFTLIEYLRNNNMLGGNDLELMFDLQTLAGELEHYMPSQLGQALSLLQRLQVPTGDRYHKQWHLRLLLEKFPEIEERVSLTQEKASDERLSQWQTEAISGDPEAEVQLKIQLLSLPEVLPWLIDLRLAQGKSLEDIHREICIEHPNLLKSGRSNIAGFFLQQIKDPVAESTRHELTGQLKPEWLKQEPDPARRQQLLFAMIRSTLHTGRFCEHYFSELAAHVSLPAGFNSWHQLVTSLADAPLPDSLIKTTPCQLKPMLKKSRKQQRIALHTLIYLATEGNSAALLTLADHIYEHSGQLHDVVTRFSRWHLPCPYGESWSVAAIKQLMCRKSQMSFIAVTRDDKGVLKLPPEYTGKDNQCLIAAPAIAGLSATNAGETVTLGDSSRSGKGVFPKKPVQENEVIAAYQGNIVLRLPVSGPCLAAINEQGAGFTPSKKVPHLHVLLKPRPEPHFMAEKDTYVAWSILRQSTETETCSPWQLTGCHGAEIGFDGNDQGNILRELNHDDNPTAILLPAVNPDMIDWVDGQFRIYMKPAANAHRDMVNLVVALEDIDPEQEGDGELTFDYHPLEQGEIDFSLAGTDVLTNPGHFLTIDEQQGIVLKPEFQPDQNPDSTPGSESGDSDSTDSGPVASQTTFDANYPGTEFLPPDEVIPIMMGPRPLPYSNRNASLPKALKHYEQMFAESKEEVKQKARSGDQGALAYMAFGYMHNLEDKTVATYLKKCLHRIGINASPLAIFNAIERYIPMPETQLMSFLSIPALNEMRHKDPHRHSRYFRRFVINAISIGKMPSDVAAKLKTYKATPPPIESAQKLWSEQKIYDLLPGLPVYYAGIPEKKLKALYDECVASSSQPAGALLVSAARHGAPKALQYHILSWCSRIGRENSQGSLRPDLQTELNPDPDPDEPESRKKRARGNHKPRNLAWIASHLNKCRVLRPGSKADQPDWKSDNLASYILSFMDDFDDQMTDNETILHAQVLAENKEKRDFARKQYILKRITLGGDLYLLMQSLRSMHCPPPDGHSRWTLQAFADFTRKNYSGETLFTRPIESVAAAVSSNYPEHEHDRLELMLRAMLGHPGALDHLLLKERELIKDPDKIARRLRHFWPDTRASDLYWTSDRVRRELDELDRRSASE